MTGCSAAFQVLDEEEKRLLWDSALGVVKSGTTSAQLADAGLSDFCSSPQSVGLTGAMLVAEVAGRSGSAIAMHLIVGANLGHLWSGARGPVPDPTGFAFAPGRYGWEPAGTADIVDGRLSGRLRFVDGLPADRLLIPIDEGFAVVSADDGGWTATSTAGLGVDPLHDVIVESAPLRLLAMSSARRDDIIVAMRLLLVRRTRGAVAAAFDSAVEYVTTRRQFGQPLGRFQAMQHKLADCHVALAASEELLDTAAAQFDANAENWRYFALTALIFSADALRRAMFEVQHAFGAIGYADEHLCARQFRRVNSDLSRFGGVRAAKLALSSFLKEEAGRIPALSLGEQAEAYRAHVRAWLGSTMDPALRAAEAAKPFRDRGWNMEFARSMGAAGFIGAAWPVEAGGEARSPLEQLAWAEEFAQADAPIMSQSSANWIAGPEIARHGSTHLRESILPAILRGEVLVCLGYSEPEAGSDLGQLRTRAVREGDHYRINGQKLWGTGTDKATHVLLAARTGGDDLPGFKGVSLFLVPMTTPGITITPHMALYGHTFSTQFYDNVDVPADYRIGEENGGGAILGAALASERILMGGSVAKIRRLFELLADHILSDPALSQDAVLLDRLAGFAADIEAARHLVFKAVRTQQLGGVPLVEGAMAKLFAGELGERFAIFGMEALGSAATLGEGNAGAPLAGRIEQELRRAPMGVIGGGAAEVQKTIIAQRGLNLPR